MQCDTIGNKTPAAALGSAGSENPHEDDAHIAHGGVSDQLMISSCISATSEV